MNNEFKIGDRVRLVQRKSNSGPAVGATGRVVYFSLRREETDVCVEWDSPAFGCHSCFYQGEKRAKEDRGYWVHNSTIELINRSVKQSVVVDITNDRTAYFLHKYDDIDKIIRNVSTRHGRVCTIVILKDGRKGLVRCSADDTDNPDLGILYAYVKALKNKPAISMGIGYGSKR
jgi:hypothetical protein